MNSPRPAPRSLVVAAFAAVSLIWGSTYLAIRIALVDFPPFTIGAIRFLAAGAALSGLAVARGERWPTLAQWSGAALVGGLFFVVGNGLLCVAEKSVSSGLVAVLVATMPLWATAFSRLFGERVSRREGAGVALGMAGVAVMNLGGELGSSGGGVILALLAPMGWALGTVLSKRVSLARGAMGAGSQMLAGGVAVLGIAVATRERLPASPSWSSLAALGYLAVMGSLVGFTAFAYLLRHTRAAVATSYAYINPVVALVLGIVTMHERVDVASMVGGAVVLCAVLLVTRRAPEPRAPTASLPPQAKEGVAGLSTSSS